jgi:hypothetical protein
MLYRKYIVFGCESYYPLGGLNDVQGDYDTLQEAREEELANGYDDSYIIDRDTWDEV